MLMQQDFAGFLFTETQTLDSVQRRLRGDDIHRRGALKVIPRMVCADGFSFSVQASDFHGCEPRSMTGPYTSVEVGCLSEPADELLPFMMEEDVPPQDGIYQFVPVELVVQMINDHGGLVL